jgi:hypothetical protein
MYIFQNNSCILSFAKNGKKVNLFYRTLEKVCVK